jgi:hypothetical protein
MRATNLQYRSPREANLPYYQSIELNTSKLDRPKFFERENRFCHGSIYDLHFKKTDHRVGPGAYTSPKILKPCTARMYPSIVERYTGTSEAKFEICNGSRVLQAGNFNRREREMLEEFTDRNAIKANFA